MERTDAMARATDNLAQAFTALAEFEAGSRYVRIETPGVIGKVCETLRFRLKITAWV